jgi:hypothetical protein
MHTEWRWHTHTNCSTLPLVLELSAHCTLQLTTIQMVSSSLFMLLANDYSHHSLSLALHWATIIVILQHQRVYMLQSDNVIQHYIKRMNSISFQCSITSTRTFFFCKLWGSDSGIAEDLCLVECYVVSLGEQFSMFKGPLCLLSSWCIIKVWVMTAAKRQHGCWANGGF